MLVLTRKTDERIMIGDEITITVVRIGTDQVRIGIDAPRDVVIRREELAERIAEQPSDAIVSGLTVPVPLADQIEAAALLVNKAEIAP